MTILFTASKYSNTKQLREIITLLNDMGHTVKLRHTVSDLDKSKERKSKTVKFKRDLEVSDFLIAEASEASLSLGLEIATAIDKAKHVLILSSSSESTNDLNDFVQENSSRYIHMVSYNSKNLESALKDAINQLKKQLNYVLYVELPSEYGSIMEEIQSASGKSKKLIIQESLKEYRKNFKPQD